MDNSEKYEYNNSSELSEENVTINDHKYSIAYAYDDAGNRTSVKKTGYNGEFQINYSYDSNNRLISTNEIKKGISYKTYYTYDNNGNQTRVEKYRKNDDGVFRLNIETLSAVAKVGNDEKFEYNGLNQLVGYEGLAGSYNGKMGLSAKYKYMPNGYRLSKDVNGITTKFLWDGDNIVAEVNGANAITKSYYRGINLISDSSDNYYMSDVHGNVIETYDIYGDYPDNCYFYNAFGSNDWFESCDTISIYNPWGYCGQYYDFETDMYYMRARYYNINTGRFITEDPIKDGLNWYAYCGNNPVNLTDTNGLKPGDPFRSADEAAIDFGNFANPSSIKWGVEYGTYIYSYIKKVNGRDMTFYSYVKPFTNNNRIGVAFSDKDVEKIEEDNNFVGTAHTHSSIAYMAKYTEEKTKIYFNKNSFERYWNNEEKTIENPSFEDKQVALHFGGDNHYLVAPTGIVKRYGYDDNASYKENTIYFFAPREKKMSFNNFTKFFKEKK